MTLRRAHGRARELGASLVSEGRPLDEIPTANASDTAANLAQRRVLGRPFERGNRAAAGRKPALAGLGLNVDATDPEYRKVLRQAARYRRRRCSEIAAQYGALSAGAAALVASAALALMASRYLYGRAARNGDTNLLPTASRLAESARGLEISALDVAQREAKDRPKQANEAWLAVLNGGKR